MTQLEGTKILTNNLLIEIPKQYRNVRLFKRATGAAKSMDGKRIIAYGIVGGADIEGIISPHGRHLEVEVKYGTDTQSEDQKNFQAAVVAMGAVYIVARSVEQCIEELGRWA